jgi:glucan 1,3-beta-glucosidase
VTGARAAVVAIAALGALGGLAWWHARGQPVALPDAPIDRLPCVSYAPYRLPGQTPFTKGFVVSPAQIDADLALLAQRTRCVRTYSVDQGLDAVPGLARKHGLRVLLGLWIGRERAENERELARGLDVIRRDADAIDAVIVGNEVLLRRELPASVLADYIRRVRAATTLPVTYADVWEFWLQHPEVADAASFVTVHLLPYWEDEPMPIGRAVDHVVRVLARVRAAFPGRDVFVGEAGWPSRGRRREGAVPSAVNQARFVRELAAAATHRLRYNVIEAFDQPWKRRLEGTVGGFWGVLDAAGREKFPLRGPVVEDPGWRRGLVAAGLGAALFAFAGAAARSRLRGLFLLALAGAGLGAAVMAQQETIVAASRDAFELALGATFGAISAGATLLARPPRAALACADRGGRRLVHHQSLAVVACGAHARRLALRAPLRRRRDCARPGVRSALPGFPARVRRAAGGRARGARLGSGPGRGNRGARTRRGARRGRAGHRAARGAREHRRARLGRAMPRARGRRLADAGG